EDYGQLWCEHSSRPRISPMDTDGDSDCSPLAPTWPTPEGAEGPPHATVAKGAMGQTLEIDPQWSE
ncbi:MAG: hypothetical protein ABIZ04_07825, partial [Opitutus sp.]